jgi:hypothetical protein
LILPQAINPVEATKQKELKLEDFSARTPPPPADDDDIL